MQTYVCQIEKFLLVADLLVALKTRTTELEYYAMYKHKNISLLLINISHLHSAIQNTKTLISAIKKTLSVRNI
jgi:hypothetical protein